MKFEKIGFIGCGNMGGAIAKVCAGKGEIYLANRTAAKAETLAARICGHAVANQTVASTCDLIFLGVKPQMMRDMLTGIAPVLAKRSDRFVLVSMAAGLEMSTIAEMAGGDYPIIRIMPNTPVAVGEGVVQFCTVGVTEAEQAAFEELLKDAGKVDTLPEQLIDAASALSGCGPAFVYPIMEAMADGAVACGLPRGKAMEYAAQTLIGAGKLMLASDKHPGALKDAVCSPAGSTIQGVRVLEERAVRGAMMDAVIAAFEKNKQLGK